MIRQERAGRYEYAWSGEMIHMDMETRPNPDVGCHLALEESPVMRTNEPGISLKGVRRNRRLLRAFT